MAASKVVTKRFTEIITRFELENIIEATQITVLKYGCTQTILLNIGMVH